MLCGLWRLSCQAKLVLCFVPDRVQLDSWLALLQEQLQNGSLLYYVYDGLQMRHG